MGIDERIDTFRRVFWIGGATCAGKSTAADILGERHGTQAYHFDRREPFHIHRSIPEEQPHLIGFMGKTMDEKWVNRSPEEMAEEVLACWAERFPMVIDDLARVVAEGPVIAEGVGLFPALVAPFLSQPPNAVWLIPTPEFQRQVRDTRESTVADNPHISDRQRAYRNLLARDALIATHVRTQATALGLPTIPVDADNVAGVIGNLEPGVARWLALDHPGPADPPPGSR